MLMSDIVLKRLSEGKMLRIISIAIEGCDGQPAAREWECIFVDSGERVDHQTIVYLLHNGKIKRQLYTQSCEEMVLA